MASLYKESVFKEDMLGSSKTAKAADQIKATAAAHLERAFIELYYAHSEVMLLTDPEIKTSLSKTLLKAKNLIESACVTLSNSNADLKE
jgi:hypothetical protein